MIGRIPAWLVALFWVAIGLAVFFVLLAIVGIIVHALGGGLIAIHSGHFVFDIGYS